MLGMPGNNPTAVDYSFGAPDYAQAHASGVRLFCRYLSPSSGKDFTAAEVHAIHATGAAALALWEGYANDALKGYNEGYANGKAAVAALSALHSAVGYSPKNKQGIAFAVDFDTNSGEWATLDAYFAGVRRALGANYLVGVYGEAALLDHLVGGGHCDFGFQTYAWSGGVVSTYAHLYQYLNGQNRWGGTVDYCDIRNLTKLGAWFPPGSENDNPSGEDWLAMATEQQVSDLIDQRLMAFFTEHANVVHASAFGSFNHDDKGHARSLMGGLARIRKGDFVPFYDANGHEVK